MSGLFRFRSGLFLAGEPAMNQLAFFLVVSVLIDTFFVRTVCPAPQLSHGRPAAAAAAAARRRHPPPPAAATVSAAAGNH